MIFIPIEKDSPFLFFSSLFLLFFLLSFSSVFFFCFFSPFYSFSIASRRRASFGFAISKRILRPGIFDDFSRLRGLSFHRLRIACLPADMYLDKNSIFLPVISFPSSLSLSFSLSLSLSLYLSISLSLPLSFFLFKVKSRRFDGIGIGSEKIVDRR